MESKNESLTKSSCLDMLLEDWKVYSFLDGLTRNQAGDHYQHSLWVHYATKELVSKDSYYKPTIPWTKREKEIFCLAGLLHDVGKAGRSELFPPSEHKLAYEVELGAHKTITKIGYKFDNEEHCQIGFEYLGNKFFNKNESFFTSRQYMLCNGEVFNFDALFKDFNVSDDEQKEIAILVGMHFSFGNVKQGSMTYQAYLEKLQTFVNAVNYNDGQIDDKLLEKTIIIQVSDVKGLSHCKSCCTCVIDVPQNIEPVRTFELAPPFQRFGYEVKDNQSKALLVKAELMDYFKTEYQKK